MIKRALLLFALALTSFSCSDSDIDIIEVEATVLDVSDEADFESCEWILFFNGNRYMPGYLPPGYRIDGYRVRAKIELLSETASCNSSLKQIRIEQIASAN